METVKTSQQREETHPRSFLPLFVTNFFGAANDNFLKTLVSFVVIGWCTDARMKGILMGLTAGALVLPYVFLSPLADRLTVVWPKCKVLRLAKWAELPIMAVAIAGFILESAPLVIVAVFLMGIQSALYSPSKYALVRDIGGEARISSGMGCMDGVTFLAVLAGTVGGACAKDLLAMEGWYAVLAALAIAGVTASYFIRAREEPNRALHAINPLRYLRRAHRMVAHYPGVPGMIMALSLFWGVAALMQMGLLVYGPEVLGLSAFQTGGALALAAVGIVAGQVWAGFFDRRLDLLAWTPVTGLVTAALLAVLCFVPLNLAGFCACLGVQAFVMGVFKLPMDAEIQRVVKGPRLNTVLAYFNQVSFIYMLGASGVYAGVSALAGPRAFLVVGALAMVVAATLPILHCRRVLCRLGRWALARRYAVTLQGAEAFATEGPCLVLPAHPAIVDPMLLVTHLETVAVRPLADEAYVAAGGPVGRVLKTLGAVCVPDLRRHRSAAGAKIARGLQDVVTEALADGQSVLLYPGGHIWTEPREDIGTRQLAYNVCGALPPGVRVIGVRTEGLWGSIWSRKGRKTSPDFALTFLRALVLWPGCLITRRRRMVTMTFADLTDQAKTWSTLTRLEFNRRLEAWYNQEMPTA